MPGTVQQQDVDLIVGARHWDPFSVLGPHVVDLNRKKAVVVRAMLPLAARAYVVVPEEGKKRRTEIDYATYARYRGKLVME